MPLVVEYVGLTYLSKSRDAMTPPAPTGTTVLPLTIQYIKEKCRQQKVQHGLNRPRGT